MAYDFELAERLRDALCNVPEVVERRMFGGLAFLIGGNMTVVVSSKGGLMIRADPATAASLVETTEAEFVEIRGRQMRGWLHIAAEAVRSETELRPWVERAVDYSSTLPQKS